jgi:hypothetical protein
MAPTIRYYLQHVCGFGESSAVGDVVIPVVRGNWLTLHCKHRRADNKPRLKLLRPLPGTNTAAHQALGVLAQVRKPPMLILASLCLRHKDRVPIVGGWRGGYRGCGDHEQCQEWK